MRTLVALVAVLLVVSCTPEVTSGAGASPAPAVEVVSAPDIPIPQGPPPESLERHDLVDGVGAPVTEGDRLRVHFAARSWETGEVVESTWDRGAYEFVLGSDAEIPGWNAAIEGMRVGGLRRITIPPQNAYGDQQPPGVGADDTLVFVVQLVEVVEDR